MRSSHLRFILLGVEAMNSPRYAPAGLLVEHSSGCVMIDGGPGAEPDHPVDAWLVTDQRAELMRDLRRLAAVHGLRPEVATFRATDLLVEPHPVVHTAHPTFGYLISADRRKVVRAPEFFEFPDWAGDADLMFAEAAGWNRRIRFVGGIGGHASALEVSAAARAHQVRRLVFAHIGRPTIRALDAGQQPPFGEVGAAGQMFVAIGRGWRRACRGDSVH